VTRCMCLLPLAMLLSACGSSDTPLTLQSVDDVSLAGIGDQQVVFNETLTISLKAATPTGVDSDYSSNGTVGPHSNPYSVSGNPAVFDTVAGIFTWTPGAGEAGKYSVQFTVTTQEAEARSASEAVTITVWSLGEKLYTEHCAECHGADGAGTLASQNRSIQGATAAQIQIAFSNVTDMNQFIGDFSSMEIQAIAEYLATLMP